MNLLVAEVSDVKTQCMQNSDQQVYGENMSDTETHGRGAHNTEAHMLEEG